MPGTLGTIHGTMMRASGQTVAGLVYGQDGVLITQVGISAIAWAVLRYNADGTTTQTGSGTVTVSAAVFNVPVTTDPRYTLAGGYNFLFTAPAVAFATPKLRHEIVITFTPFVGEPFVQVWDGIPQ